MVGWWKTLVGNLYEHVTIWEYDDMTAFERAIGILGSEPKFAKFVAQRDPLLAGEQNRFLRLTEKAEPPTLAEPAKFVVHEIHRVPLAKADGYRDAMERRGLALLKKHGFRPAGPFRVEIGRWTEFTYLFRFNSIAERERLIADFAASSDLSEYRRILTGNVSEVTTRLLVPAPFVGPTVPPAARREIRSELLFHVESIADGVFAAGFADRYHSANCGWVVEGEAATLVDLPRGVKIVDFLSEARRIGGKPIRSVVLTHLEPGDAAIVAELPRHGVGSIITTPAIRDRLVAGMGKGSTSIQVANARSVLPGGMRLLSADDVMSAGASAVFFPERRVLFAGPLVVNGPRAVLPGTDTARWITSLRVLERLEAARVVPGFGSWTGGRMIARQRHFLEELRRQIAFVISQGHPPSAMKREIRLPGDAFVWMPYDTPTVEDLNHVYHELTVPAAPFDGRPPSSGDSRPHALVLYADQPHEPAAIVEGLTPVFEATGVVPHFTVDVRALTAENLSKVELLVILRDGLMRPTEDPSSHYEWMTDAQQEAVDRFVRAGGGLLCLHNSLGLYPAHGAYLKLAGGVTWATGRSSGFASRLSIRPTRSREASRRSRSPTNNTLPRMTPPKFISYCETVPTTARRSLPRAGPLNPVAAVSATSRTVTRENLCCTPRTSGSCKMPCSGVCGEEPRIAAKNSINQPRRVISEGSLVLRAVTPRPRSGRPCLGVRQSSRGALGSGRPARAVPAFEPAR